MVGMRLVAIDSDTSPVIRVKRSQRDWELNGLAYGDYLRTDHWRQVRRRALRQANYRCQVCNTGEKRLHVHHRTYINRGCELPTDVTVLCEDCHALFHQNGRVQS